MTLHFLHVPLPAQLAENELLQLAAHDRAVGGPQRQSLADANTKLVHYAATLERLTITRERNRLARELHDTLAHTLSAVAVELEAVSALWDVDPTQARAMLTQSLTVTRTGLATNTQDQK